MCIRDRYGYTYKLLSYDKGPKKLFDPFFIEMDKKSQSYPRFAHPGTEFIYMLQGRVEYRFGEYTYLLEPGDAFTFSGDVVHGPEKLLDERAKFISIIIYGEAVSYTHLDVYKRQVAGLSDEETEKTAVLLRQLAGKHSVVVVEHDMHFVERLGCRVTVLHQGHVLAEGDLATVQADARVIEVYLGR